MSDLRLVERGAGAISLGGIISLYYFSPSERNARSFAKKAIEDQQWLEVVKVEDAKE